MEIAYSAKPWINTIARIGLTAKGIVYSLIGILAFMAAFEIAGQRNEESDRSGVFELVKDWPAGKPILALIALGLICYAIWRGVQTFANYGTEEKKWTQKIRYLFSGITYLSIALSAISLLLYNSSDSGDQNQYWAAELMSKPFGEWLLGLGALVVAAIGIYQVWYGLSEKYRKHVQGMRLHSSVSAYLLRSGKIGYVARGVVWLIISFLLLRSTLHTNAKEAGGTGKAFQFIESSTYGSFILGALGLGLLAYGIFNFIRARYERFG